MKANVDFDRINSAALSVFPALCQRWLSTGRREGREWVVGSLTNQPGRSLKINLDTGRWCDFATGQGGGDPISLCAALLRGSQYKAARWLGRHLGVIP